jgi:hypothetical protein
MIEAIATLNIKEEKPVNLGKMASARCSPIVNAMLVQQGEFQRVVDVAVFYCGNVHFYKK